MPMLWAGRGVGRRGAARLMPSRWRRVLPAVLATWSERLPVGYGPTGSSGRPGTRYSGSGRDTVAALCGGAAPGAVGVAPPLLSLPVESAPVVGTANGLIAPATRKRVVLLPHAPIEHTDT